VKKLLEAGVPVAFTTFGGNLSDYLANVRKLIASGIDKQAALKCMTSGAAGILGVSDKIGSIEAGKQANLVLMSGDLADATSKVESIIVEGKAVKMEAGK
jgi:imidazolonepropionase-like amidohydrolase